MSTIQSSANAPRQAQRRPACTHQFAPARIPGASLRLRQRPSRRSALVTSARQQMLVHVPPHPLIKHWLAVARSKDNPPAVFRSALAELGRILIYEAMRDWVKTIDIPVETPVGKADATIIDPASPVKLIPVMRAGAVLLDQASSTIPMSETYHVGLERDERTLKSSERGSSWSMREAAIHSGSSPGKARWYLNKMPQKFNSDDRILILDPMLATGGTMETVIEEVLNRGGSESFTKVISIVAAPEALRRLSPNYPSLNVYAAMIDSELDRRGFIVPGLGDAGDRAYGTH